MDSAKYVTHIDEHGLLYFGLFFELLGTKSIKPL